MLEVSLRERLSGAMVLASDPARERHIMLDLAVRVGPQAIDVTGEISAEPIARGATFTGRGSFGWSRLSYSLEFQADDGRDLRLTLERRLLLANVYTSVTVLRGELADARGAPLGRCLLRFDAREELGRSLSSVRVSRRLRR